MSKVKKMMQLGLSFVLLTGSLTVQAMETPRPRDNVQVDPKSGLVTNAPYTYKDYVPYFFHDYYHYEGENMEFATYDVYVPYHADDQGRYQYVLASGALGAHIMQMRKEGLVELSYFIEGDKPEDIPDYRYHADSEDGMIFTQIPADLRPGTRFYPDYRHENPFEVVGILAQFSVRDVIYYDVLLVESADDQGQTKEYYAPGVGLIQSQTRVDGTTIYSRLADYK